MSALAAFKLLLALSAVIGIYLIPGRSTEIPTPVPVYLTGGQVIVLHK